jgi:hypothetical protein
VNTVVRFSVLFAVTVLAVFSWEALLRFARYNFCAEPAKIITQQNIIDVNFNRSLVWFSKANEIQ